MKYPHVGVGAILLNEKQEVLLVLRKKEPDANCWSLPGGKVELYETIEEATKREIYEELNIKIRLERLVCVTNHIQVENNVHYVCPTFFATILTETLKNNEPDKLTEIKWFPLNNLPENSTYTTINAINCL